MVVLNYLKSLNKKILHRFKFAPRYYMYGDEMNENKMGKYFPVYSVKFTW